MCVACAAGETNCPACRALSSTGGFPFDESATLEQLLNHALKSFQREWQTCVIAALIYVALIGGGAVLLGIVSTFVTLGIMRIDEGRHWSPLVFQAWELIRQLLLVPLQCIGSLGLMRMMLDVVTGRSPTAGRFFSETRLLPGALAIQLPFALVLALPPLVSSAVSTLSPSAGSVLATTWSCVFLPVLLFFGLSWWLFSVPEMLIADCGPVEAMRRAFSLGSRWRNLRVLGYAALAGALVLAGVFACGVGVLAGLPFGTLLVLSLFLALRASSGLPAATSL